MFNFDIKSIMKFFSRFKIFLLVIAVLVSMMFVYYLFPIRDDRPLLEQQKKLTEIIKFLSKEWRMAFLYLDTKDKKYVTEFENISLLVDEKIAQEKYFLSKYPDIYGNLSRIKEVREKVINREISLMDFVDYYYFVLYGDNTGFLVALYDYIANNFFGDVSAKAFDIMWLSYTVVFSSFIRDYVYLGVKYGLTKNYSFVFRLSGTIELYEDYIQVQEESIVQKLSDIYKRPEMDKFSSMIKAVKEGNFSFDIDEWFRVSSELQELLLKVIDESLDESMNFAYWNFIRDIVRYVVLVLIISSFIIVPSVIVYQIEKKNVQNMEKSLKSFSDALDKVFEGENVDQIELHGSRELQEKLYFYYYSMKDKTSENVVFYREVKDLYEKFASSLYQMNLVEFNIDQKLKEKYPEILQVLENIISSLRKVFRSITISTNRFAVEATDSIYMVYDLANNFDLVIQNTSDIDNILDKFLSLFSSIEQYISNLKKDSDSVKLVSIEFTEKFNSMYEKVSKMKEIVESYRSSILYLRDFIQKISEVLEAVNNISDQIGLLALNASIEASRAGEAGKGFVVIANEIRNLTSQTITVTEELNKSMDDFKKLTYAIQSNTENIYSESENNLRGFDEMKNSLSNLTGKIVSIEGISKDIFDKSQELFSLSKSTQSKFKILVDNITKSKSIIGSMDIKVNNFSDSLIEVTEIIKKIKIEDFSIDLAKLLHVIWRVKLLKFLNGQRNLSPEEIGNHHECYLGKWYYSVGKNILKEVPIIMDFEKDHEELHNYGKRVFELYSIGRVGEAKSMIGIINEKGNRVISDLDKIKEYLQEFTK